MKIQVLKLINRAAAAAEEVASGTKFLKQFLNWRTQTKYLGKTVEEWRAEVVHWIVGRKIAYSAAFFSAYRGDCSTAYSAKYAIAILKLLAVRSI